MNNNEFKVICTKGDGYGWVKGEIYEFKNGIIKDCKEYEWGSFCDFNEFEQWIRSNFTDIYFEEFKFNIGDKGIRKETNEEIVIYGYIIDEANNLEYIISNNKSKDTLRQKMNRYPEFLVERGEEYMDETCSFIYPSELAKVDEPSEEELKKIEEQITEEFFKLREKKMEEVERILANNEDIDNTIRKLEEQKKENNDKIEKMKTRYLF